MGTALFLAVLLLALPRLAEAACPPDSQQVIICHAGSLSAALTPVEALFTQRTGICVSDLSGGSVDLARQVTAGKVPCDIFAPADYEVIDLFLKPARYADYTIRFAQGRMVLAYRTTSVGADKIAGPDSFAPPASIPEVVDAWYDVLSQPGVRIGGSHPFLDPSGYRADMIFQLAERKYGVPNLYDRLLAHNSVNKPNDVLGATYDFQFIYEHSALAAYKADPDRYRYAQLPDDIGLSNPEDNGEYRTASVTMPGLVPPAAAPLVRVPATRVVWGLTVLDAAPDKDNAVKFLEVLFGREGVELQAASGPDPISPPVVTARDYHKLPAGLRPLVSAIPDRGGDRDDRGDR